MWILLVLCTDSLQAFRIGDFACPDILEQQREDCKAAGCEDGGIDGENPPFPCHVEDKTEKNRGDRLCRHAGCIVESGELSDGL